MTTQQLRESFLSFFEDRDHLVRPSAPLVLHDDPSSFFTSAGMQPYMAAFRGEEEPPAPRMVSIQKCNRTGDIEGVGIFNRYHTFFEMLGNFSFGDYFKQGAIDLAWEYVHEVLQLPTEDLWITVFTDDDEAEEIWHQRIGIPRERILRFGREENWWPTAQWAGPCGPCTEIYVDLGPELGCPEGCEVGCAQCNRYLELWNLVFQQYTEAEDGTLTPLPQPGIDTGMGLERLALVMQGKRYTCETDELWQIAAAALEAVNEQRDKPCAYGDDPEQDAALRVITDHLRAAAFLMADGITPSNEGPGYVLRRFIRRAYRYGRNLGAREPFLYQALPAVSQAMGQAYPELSPHEDFAVSLLRSEEERFASTLEQGLNIFAELAEDLQKHEEKILPGEQAFRLYDTYGFPLDITRELAAERGLSVDEEGFEAAMQEQRERSRGEVIGLRVHDGLKIGDSVQFGALPKTETEFVGYETESARAEIVVLLQDDNQVETAQEGEQVTLVLDRTPFYAEKGGQVADHGVIVGPAGKVVVREVTAEEEAFLHHGRVAKGKIKTFDTVRAEIDPERRAAIKRHHTAAHLLQAALRQFVGDHVRQAGSWVGPERLRFDFTHHEQISEEVLGGVERCVNEWIVANLPVTCTQESLEQAKAQGVIALFGETYGEEVRVVRVGEVEAKVSFELCGGTHVSRTGEIGAFRILAESSVAAGVRRIEAVAGLAALEEWCAQRDLLRQAMHELNCPREEIPERLATLRQQIRDLERQLQQARQAQAAFNLGDLLEAAEQIGEVCFLGQVVPDADRDLLAGLADQLAAKAGEAIILLAGTQGQGATFVCKVPDSLVQAGYKAGDLVKAACAAAGGGGGGRANFAQGGGQAGQVEAGLEAARRHIQKLAEPE